MRKMFFSETKIFTNFKIKNKMKNLQEMSLNEMRETEGGFLFAAFALGLFGGIIIGLLDALIYDK